MFVPDTALTKVDLPCATCPIVPMLIVAYLEMISGLRGVTFDGSNPTSVCLAKCFWESHLSYCCWMMSSFERIVYLKSVAFSSVII